MTYLKYLETLLCGDNNCVHDIQDWAVLYAAETGDYSLLNVSIDELLAALMVESKLSFGSWSSSKSGFKSVSRSKSRIGSSSRSWSGTRSGVKSVSRSRTRIASRSSSRFKSHPDTYII